MNATAWADLFIAQPEPNFTAILPGPCQARCRFCVEPEGPPPSSVQSWSQAFVDTLDQLPEMFQTVSLSGGEPTISTALPAALNALRGLRRRRPDRLRRVVLTTNGGALHRVVDLLPGAVTHGNLSRHAADDADNQIVFGRTASTAPERVPNRGDLAEVVHDLAERGIPVNLNCVYSDAHFLGRSRSRFTADQQRQRARQFVRMARKIGATSVVFRFDHRTFDHRETWLEGLFADVPEAHRASCESCRVVTRHIEGLPVNFKRSAYEPALLHPEHELYELVLHSDGTLARDWARRLPLPLPIPEFIRQSRAEVSGSAKCLPLVGAECHQPAGNRCAPVGLVTPAPQGDPRG
jgi:organic radical activating enzyme